MCYNERIMHVLTNVKEMEIEKLVKQFMAEQMPITNAVDEEAKLIKQCLHNYHEWLVKNCSAPDVVSSEAELVCGVSSCYAVFDGGQNIVQLYQTEEKANKGLFEFKNSHPHTEFYIDKIQVN